MTLLLCCSTDDLRKDSCDIIKFIATLSSRCALLISGNNVATQISMSQHNEFLAGLQRCLDFFMTFMLDIPFG